MRWLYAFRVSRRRSIKHFSSFSNISEFVQIHARLWLLLTCFLGWGRDLVDSWLLWLINHILESLNECRGGHPILWCNGTVFLLEFFLDCTKLVAIKPFVRAGREILLLETHGPSTESLPWKVLFWLIRRLLLYNFIILKFELALCVFSLWKIFFRSRGNRHRLRTTGQVLAGIARGDVNFKLGGLLTCYPTRCNIVVLNIDYDVAPWLLLLIIWIKLAFWIFFVFHSFL